MVIEAAAVLAMEGNEIAPETRARILHILHCYESGLLKDTDCTGCVWLGQSGCQNPKDCQRDELTDRYQAEEGFHEDGKFGTDNGGGGTDAGG